MRMQRVCYFHLSICSEIMSPFPVLLSSFAKLRKEIISFVLYIRPHRTARLSLARFFVKYCVWGLLENLSKKFKLYWYVIRITGILLEDFWISMIISLRIFLRMRIISRKICIESHISCAIIFPPLNMGH
jgi:hypothetical protein